MTRIGVAQTTLNCIWSSQIIERDNLHAARADAMYAQAVHRYCPNRR